MPGSSFHKTWRTAILYSAVLSPVVCTLFGNIAEEQIYLISAFVLSSKLVLAHGGGNGFKIQLK